MSAALKWYAARLLVALLQYRAIARGLNAIYLRLGYSARHTFWALFAKIYRAQRRPIAIDEWKIAFAGRTLRMPLSKDNLDLEWDTAVSIVGHDPEIKRTYDYFIGSEFRPNVFIDIGANYGTHSLLHLAHNIKTITFEPIPNCHDYFLRACELNSLQADLRGLALGDETGTVVMVFPEHETWLGSTDASHIGPGVPQEDLCRAEVKLSTSPLEIGDAVNRGDKVLIKIDVEGAELKVLNGAKPLITAHSPMIIFEALGAPSATASTPFLRLSVTKSARCLLNQKLTLHRLTPPPSILSPVPTS